MTKSTFFFLLAIVLFSLQSHSQTFQWGSSQGGNGFEDPHDMHIDLAGNIYATGEFTDTSDFDPGPGVFNLASSGDTDMFVSKLDPNGNFMWAINIGSTGGDEGRAIVTDSLGFVYIGGNFRFTTDFDPGPGVANRTASGLFDGYLLKLDPNGNFVWVQHFPGSFAMYFYTLAITPGNNVICGGHFEGIVDFDPGPGTLSFNAVSQNGFIFKMDPLGNLVWANHINGMHNYIFQIKCDPLGNIYYGGRADGYADYDPGPGVYAQTADGTELNVAKYDSMGNFNWVFLPNVDSSEYSQNNDIVLDGFGNIYATGTVLSTMDFDPGPGNATLNVISNDQYLLKLDTSGNFKWVRGFTGSGYAEGRTVDLDENGNLFLTGFFLDSVDLDPGPAVQMFSTGGDLDVNLVWLDTSGTFLNAGTLVGPTGFDRAFDAETGPNGENVVLGNYRNTVDLNPWAGQAQVTSTGFSDIFQVKFGSCPPGSRSLQTICKGDSVLFHGQILTATGTYVVNFPSLPNCDSIVSLILTVIDSTSATINPVTCGSYLSPAGNTYTASGTYTETIPNAANCDSVITINLTVGNSSTATLNPVTCGSYLSPSGNTYTSTGTYTDTIPNSTNCDSVITINLTVNTASTSTLSPVTCGSYLSPSGNTYTASGTYTDTIPSSVNCDSVITINLTVNTASTATLNPMTCGSYLSPAGNTYNASGTYTDTIPNAVNCDSVITINLTITQTDTSVTSSGITLTSNDSISTWQWLDCDNGFAPLPGEIFQALTPVISGSYAVQLIQGTCIDTSACNAVLVIGIEENPGHDFRLYPNPGAGFYRIDFDRNEPQIELQVLDVRGKQVYQNRFENAETVQFDPRIAEGVYFLWLRTESYTAVRKLIRLR